MPDAADTLDRSWAQGRPEALEVVSETDRHGKPLRTVIDMDTGLVRNDPIPGDEELARFYSEDYRKSYKGASRPRRRQILRNFRRVAGHIRRFRDVLSPSARVLDVGAGSGEFAFLMTRSRQGGHRHRAERRVCRLLPRGSGTGRPHRAPGAGPVPGR